MERKVNRPLQARRGASTWVTIHAGLTIRLILDGDEGDEVLFTVGGAAHLGFVYAATASDIDERTELVVPVLAIEP